MLLRGLLVVALLGVTLVGCGDGAVPGGGSSGRPLVPQGEALVRTTPGGMNATGEVKNTSPDKTYSGMLQVTLKDAQGKIVGSLVGAVNDVPPGGVMPYTAIGQAPTAEWATVEQAITAHIPR